MTAKHLIILAIAGAFAAVVTELFKTKVLYKV